MNKDEERLIKEVRSLHTYEVLEVKRSEDGKIRTVRRATDINSFDIPFQEE
jgi:hypothetical protein